MFTLNTHYLQESAPVCLAAGGSDSGLRPFNVASSALFASMVHLDGEWMSAVSRQNSSSYLSLDSRTIRLETPLASGDTNA